LKGAALAHLLKESLLLFVTVLMMAWLHFRQPKKEKTWQGFSMEAMQGWGAYIKVGLMDPEPITYSCVIPGSMLGNVHVLQHARASIPEARSPFDLQVAFPSMVACCLDWWVLELMVLLAGLTGENSDLQVGLAGDAMVCCQGCRSIEVLSLVLEGVG